MKFEELLDDMSRTDQKCNQFREAKMPMINKRKFELRCIIMKLQMNEDKENILKRSHWRGKKQKPIPPTPTKLKTN